MTQSIRLFLFMILVMVSAFAFLPQQALCAPAEPWDEVRDEIEDELGEEEGSNSI